MPAAPEQRPDRTRGTALFADHLSQIGRRDAQFQYCNLFAFHFANRHFIGNIHQRFGDLRYQFFHPFHPPAWIDSNT